MNKKTFFIICCAFSLIIAVQSIIQVITRGSFIDSTETFAYNFGHVTGIAVRILGSIVISFYFMRRFFENRRSLS